MLTRKCRREPLPSRSSSLQGVPKAGAWESSSDVQGTEWFTLPPAQLRHALPLRAIDDAAFVAAPAAGEVWSEKGEDVQLCPVRLV